MPAILENNLGGRFDQAPWGGDNRLRNAFAPFVRDPKKLTIIYRLLEQGRQIHDESLGIGRPKPESFEALVDRYAEDNDARFLFEDHPVLAGNTLTVIRFMAGPLVEGSKKGLREINFRQSGRGVSDLSGRKN